MISRIPSVSKASVSTIDYRQVRIPWGVLFAIAHIPLALAMDASPFVATLHSVATIAIGVTYAMSRTSLCRVAYIIAYITGAEVLWRMTGALTFWEIGKYAVAAICVLTFLRIGARRIPSLPLVFFILLLPSTFLLVSNVEWSVAREQISFNLSGPLAFSICAIFFSQVTLSADQIRRLFFAIIYPIIGIVAIATYSTIAYEGINWTTSSNFTASGGFGPNQVSAVLGIGVFAIWILLLFFENTRGTRFLLIFLGIWLLSQGLLTFSRGGIFNALAPIAIVTIQRLLRRTRHATSVAPLLLGAIAASIILIPQLDEFTGGMLEKRFLEDDLTNRDILMQADLQAFEQNPLWGVGPGEAREYRGELLGIVSAAHTEYTRLLAEHGILGLLSMIILGIMTWDNYRRTESIKSMRSIKFALVLWGLLYMTHSAMRIVAPAFMLGLTFAEFRENDQPQQH